MRTVNVFVATAVVAGLVVATAAVAGGGSSSKVTVTMKEWATKPSPPTARAGKVTFAVKNNGHLLHEFIVVKTNLPANKLPVKGTTANLSKVKVEGKVPSFKPGQRRTLSLTLPKGHYVLLCNLPAHYKSGQYASFSVS